MARKTNTNINGKEYYRVRRTIGHTANGKEIIKSFYGTGEKDANEKADKYINDLKLGLLDNGKFITINILLPKWLLEVKKNEVKPTTFDKYEGLYRNYISKNIIADIPISDVKSLPQNSDYVFSSSKTHTHFDIKWAEKVWAKKTKGTKFENKRFHDLRHTFATMLLLKGANLIQIKELLGHSSVKITEIYLDALPKTKEEIINKIDDLL